MKKWANDEKVSGARFKRCRDAFQASGICLDDFVANIAADVVVHSTRNVPVWQAAILPYAIARAYEAVGANDAGTVSFIMAHAAAVHGFLGLDWPDDLAQWSYNYDVGVDIRTVVDAMLENEQ